MTSDLLIELGCEDLPARYVVPLANALNNGIAAGLKKRGIAQGDAHTYATPRRIAVIVSAVATQQPEQQIERFGPAIAAAFKDGQPTPAALGFAKSCGVDFSAIGQKDGKLHYAKTAPGKKTSELIPEIFEETLKQMDELVPKRMRWGSGNETFVRPVQWICALLGKDVIPLQRFDLIAGRLTYGHRFHAPAAIELKSPADYADKLKAAHVWADVAARKIEIKHQIEAQATALKGYARITEDLLDEVTALVEKPVAITGHFEDRFLELPPEVIVATVETNQRYFTVFKDADHKTLTNAFITISNVESKDVSQVIAGNERVVRPRLADALFFWQQDLKQPLLEYQKKLATVTFQKELGTIEQKVIRVRNLAETICQHLYPQEYAEARINHASASWTKKVETPSKAAALCKNDLVTKMVYEFPELQGIMGGYYAEKSRESAAVAKAIGEHYMPTQQGTPIPSTREGQIVALADKLDTLAGIFAIGQKPTASKDPFALRRAALGALRICIEGQLPLDFTTLLKSAFDAQPAGKRDTTTLKELTDFVFERLRSLIVEPTAFVNDKGQPVTFINDASNPVVFTSGNELFEAVNSLGITSPLDFFNRVQALRNFWALPEAKVLAKAHKRIRKILPQATNLPDADSFGVLRLRGSDADRALISSVESAEDFFAATIHGVSRSSISVALDMVVRPQYEKYLGALNRLATIAPQVSNFFEQSAMVLDENIELRAGRVTLLRHLDELCREVADISLLPG